MTVKTMAIAITPCGDTGLSGLDIKAIADVDEGDGELRERVLDSGRSVAEVGAV